MGITLSTAKRRLASGWDVQGKNEEAREALNIIERLVRIMKDQFVKDTCKNFDIPDMPIIKILRYWDWEECLTASDMDRLGPALKRRIAAFSSGSVAEGLYQLAKHAIDGLLAEPRGTFPSRNYAIFNCDALGAVTRLDIFFFAHRFSSSGLRATANPLIACKVVQSTASFEFSDNTLRALVGRSFRHSKPTLIKAIYHDIHDALAYDKSNRRRHAA